MSNERKKFAERLNHALDRAGIPKKGRGRQTQLAALFNVSQESARKWLSGESFPDTKRIPEIAKQFSINAQWLLSGIGNINPYATVKDFPTENSPHWIKVPILSWEEAGKWKKILPSILKNTKECNWAWSETEVSDNAYALRVRDDSMLPRYEPNSLLIIDPNYVPAHKHIVIYLLDKEKEATCKQLIIDGKFKYLKPHNPNYPVYAIQGNDKYCGSIRQARMIY